MNFKVGELYYIQTINNGFYAKNIKYPFKMTEYQDSRPICMFLSKSQETYFCQILYREIVIQVEEWKLISIEENI